MERTIENAAKIFEMVTGRQFLAGCNPEHDPCAAGGGSYVCLSVVVDCLHDDERVWTDLRDNDTPATIADRLREKLGMLTGNARMAADVFALLWPEAWDIVPRPHGVAIARSPLHTLTVANDYISAHDGFTHVAKIHRTSLDTAESIAAALLAKMAPPKPVDIARVAEAVAAERDTIRRQMAELDAVTRAADALRCGIESRIGLCSAITRIIDGSE